MTEHLPECNYQKNPDRNSCICDRLRACEDRVAKAFHVVRKDDTNQWEKFSRDQFNAGYAAALRQGSND